MRLDVYLSTQGLCDSRARAQDAIQEGRVTVNGRIAKKSSMPVDDSMDIKLRRRKQHLPPARAISCMMC